MLTPLLKRAALVSFLACAFANAVFAADTGAFWIYKDGSYKWPGDYSYNATIDYRDKSGMPEGETYDVAVTVTDPWGAWQPYATGMNFNRAGKTSLLFKIKPTRGGSNFTVQFLKVGDKPVVDQKTGGQLSLNISDYCPLTAGAWTSCTLPLDVLLTDNGQVLQDFYKFAIQSHLGGPDKFFVADVAIQ